MILQRQPRDVIGIVGGMGPRASTAFLSTLYDFTLDGVEQNAGRFILFSDPTIPDRTEAFLGHHDEIVLEPFVEILSSLQRLQVAKIVVCCITLHYLLPRLPAHLQKHIFSLVDTIFAALEETRERHLLLCTRATLQLRLFQDHPQWERCAHSIILPQEQDQEAIHELIYQLKMGGDIATAATTVQALLGKYKVDSFIAGCTEFHLVTRHFMTAYNCQQPYHCIDPLAIIARELAKTHH